MRRHATMGLAFVLPLVVSVMAVAQPKGGSTTAAAKGDKADKKTADAGATTGAGAGAAGAGGATGGAMATGDAGATTASGTGAATGNAGGGAAAAGPSAGTTAAGTMDGPAYAVRLRDLEARVDELKDKIRLSHTRLSLLSDTIMSGGAAGARAEVVLQNEMSNAFRLVRALVVMDGAVQYNRQDETGALAEQKEIPIFSGSVPPGDHTIQVLLNFQGHGFGVFTYLRGYKFEVKSSHAFTVTEGKAVTLSAIALERGGVTTPLEQRPAIDWREKVGGFGSGAPAAPGGATPSASPGAPSAGVGGGAGVTTAPGSAAASGSVNLGGGQK